jgi:hypothetical protein
VTAAGLPEQTTTHDVRHHYASVLLAQGELVIVVAERLGHENANLVLLTYGHLMPDLRGTNPPGDRRRVVECPRMCPWERSRSRELPVHRRFRR